MVSAITRLDGLSNLIPASQYRLSNLSRNSLPKVEAPFGINEYHYLKKSEKLSELEGAIF